MDNRELAHAIIDALGGPGNIVSIAHCATRLRLSVRDEGIAKIEAVRALERVRGVMEAAGQIQVILGTGLVNKVHGEAVAYLGSDTAGAPLTDASAAGVARADGGAADAVRRAIRIFGDVFVPIIPVLVATGLFMGLRSLLTQELVLGVFGLAPSDVPANFLTFTQLLTDTAFSFLPALVCWSTFKVFGGSPVLGIVIGLMLVNPILPNAGAVSKGNADPLVFFGVLEVTGYQNSVLPAFIAGLFGAKLERFFSRHIPDVLDLILRPFLTLLIALTAALFVIGPVMHGVEDAVLYLVEALLALPFGIGGAIFGALLPLLVVTGVHNILNSLEIILLSQTGWNMLNGVRTMPAAMAGAVLAVAICTRSTKMKQVAYPSALSAALGITEPALFGVALPGVFPFVATMIGGGLSGFLGSLLGLKATGMGLTAIPGILLYLNEQLPVYLLVNGVAFAVSFVVSFVLYQRKKKRGMETELDQ